MSILSCFVIELVTVIGSVAIGVNSVANGLIQVTDDGYKLKEEAFEEYRKILLERDKEGISSKIKNAIIFIPFVNLGYSIVRSFGVKKKIMNDPVIRDALIPLTEEEKTQYKMLDNKFQKIIFAGFLNNYENKDEVILGFVGNTPIVVDTATIALHEDELEHIDYTLDEVKKISEVCTYPHIIGTIEGKNVAILNLSNHIVKRVIYHNEGLDAKHTFEPMSEEEANGKRFSVYPYTYFEEDREKVKKVVEDIKKERQYKAYKAHSHCEMGYLYDDTYDYDCNYEFENKGPVLKRTK